MQHNEDDDKDINDNLDIITYYSEAFDRVAEVARTASAKKFGLRALTYAILSQFKICGDYALYGRLWANKVFFGVT